ncbi:DUF4439 domain-containing protein [Arthrobacter sp. H20]|uniref:DUF4439 domain-containing protein n=1 Tax=Arthrobacter sp. H20 TaxID=1267981 RepID=UPI00047A1888|nr:DUF4439 domain-containing protein [Arthrobacter sp. H20]
MTSSTVVKDSATLRRSARRSIVRSFVRWTVRTLGLLLTFTLVIGLGVNLDDPEDEAPPPLSFTEEAQLGAEARATDLAIAAMALSEAISADTPGSALGGTYSVTAGILQEQADALRHPLLSGQAATATDAAGNTFPGSSSTGAGATAEASSPSATPPLPPAPTPTSFVADLFSSAQRNLDSAVTAEPGIARLLASVGASQRHQALTLAGLQDLVSPPLEPLPAAAAPTARADCAGSASQESPKAARLAEAVSAEHQSAYAYEVAAARTPDPAPLTERAENHASAAAAGEELREGVACAPLQPRFPAFDLDAGFIDDPATTLTALDTALVSMYADLVGLTDGAARLWALQRFSDIADHRHPATNSAEAFPGIGE